MRKLVKNRRTLKCDFNLKEKNPCGEEVSDRLICYVLFARSFFIFCLCRPTFFSSYRQVENFFAKLFFSHFFPGTDENRTVHSLCTIFSLNTQCKHFGA